jgi:hypothetical protein
MAAQMKQQDPSASSSDVMAASRQLRATGIDIRPDKTFQLSWAGQVMSGDWTFDKESGELLLNINKTEDLEGNPVEQAAQTWAAYLEPTNDRLRLYPVPKEAMELMKSSDSALAKGIALTKNPD